MKQKGMTLIELMIVVAIIGIISAIAYPAYQSYVEKSRRAAAQGELLELAQWMERQYTVTGSYPTATASLPFTTLPNTGDNTDPVYYNAIISGGTSVAYQLFITPSGAQTGDECGGLFIQHTGAKGSNASGGPANCWRD
ncbi:MAG: type IV pilus assembly protein PilE [Oceanospirillaceae bacterium]|jgi:type IV pilus assembly protein PilE